MTKKQFIEDVVAQIYTNPRKILAGHGISGAIFNKIIKRPDVMKYLATILTTLKTYNKGAIGLKKTSLFRIKAYKNFADLNTKAREDVDIFMSGLSEKDLADFTNEDNIITIVFDTKSAMVTGPEGDDVIEQMINASAFLKFNSAVRKEYKVPGVSYLVVMIAPSAIRSKEEKFAYNKAKINATKNKREDKPAKLRAKLKKDARRAKANLKRKRKSLENQRFKLSAQNAQYNRMVKRLGGDENTTLWDAIEAANSVETKSISRLLNSTDAKLLEATKKMMDAGLVDEAKLVLRKIKNKKKIIAALNGEGRGNMIISKRAKELRSKLSAARRQYKATQQQVYAARRAGDKSSPEYKALVRKLNVLGRRINKTRATANFYNPKNNSAMTGKAQQLAAVNKAIQQNIAQGLTITQALNKALQQQLVATPQQKQQVKQQIVQQVADGMPMQYAVQQVIQQMPQTSQQIIQQQNSLGSDDIDNGSADFFQQFLNSI